MTHRQITFGGVDRRTDIPVSYRRHQKRRDAEDNGDCLLDVIKMLKEEYSVEARTLYVNGGGELADRPTPPKDGDPRTVYDHVALVNPAWIGKSPGQLPDGRQDAVWSIPTDTYEPVPNHEVWYPLARALRTRDVDVFGTCRLHRDGGEAHLDVFVEDYSAAPVDGESLTLGITTGHDYFGNTRLYVGAAAYHDTGDGVGQVMRNVVKPRKRKHVGDAQDQVTDWYDASIHRLDEIADTLYDVVADAMHHEIPMPTIPCSLVEVYEHVGLPNKTPDNVADVAAERAISTASGPYSAYHLYKAGMWALEHEYDSRDKSRFASHVDAVNTFLFNPAKAESTVIRAVQDEIANASDENASVFDYMSDDPDTTVAALADRMETISDGVDAFKTNREKVRAMLKDEGVPAGGAE